MRVPSKALATAIAARPCDEDLVKAGVVDPKKVTRAALQKAASIAGLLLTTECLVTEVPAEAKSGLAPGGQGGTDY